MKKIKIRKQGFTLIELLVVVLIIGILAGIALPQYKKAVEKAKLSEVLININAITSSLERYSLVNNGDYQFKDSLDIDLPNLQWDEENQEYTSNNFRYWGGINYIGWYVSIVENNEKYAFEIHTYQSNIQKDCFTELTNTGKYICKYLESQGFRYIDDIY